ncbi:MAG: diphosphate--fructose-6-phosphate 1-phosphotransferase [Alphaproteobacteria bacterium GM7ARS4]|nr:diphosphate--fructose-6-phosphate 1-phosphotransferase [Alphaproteobacteria bacterium GM7ARS4]
MKGCLRKIVIAQGGGPTAVINHTLVGLVEAGRAHGVSTIWGSAFGIRGIIESQFYDLSHVTGETLASLARQTGAVLGSTRDKPDDAYCREVVALCQRHHVDAFFYIGGNDTANTMLLLSDYALTTGYDLRCFHVPKTIDNDLVLSDHTPGFPSAARFVALAFAGLNADQKSLPGVHIGIVMGRHAGFLTASAALARFHQGDGPHILCLPEEAWHRERFLTAVKACYERYGRCLIACAEGVEDDKAVPLVHSLAASSQQDPHKDPHKDPHRSSWQCAAFGAWRVRR